MAPLDTMDPLVVYHFNFSPKIIFKHHTAGEHFIKEGFKQLYESPPIFSQWQHIYDVWVFCFCFFQVRRETQDTSQARLVHLDWKVFLDNLVRLYSHPQAVAISLLGYIYFYICASLLVKAGSYTLVLHSSLTDYSWSLTGHDNSFLFVLTVSLQALKVNQQLPGPCMNQDPLG